ncbi:hypothetical protein [Actinomycetospora corticicola]|uniref:Uncharacterized protein n=1 Tax=Actinomycetospora corticicola TaxID=663602 RepID=A0A7Y9DWP3_9PSEU|nr:hypothetical protein [Actinomycetospora corticicola]NYD36821.1 hypothetical protein [Actinomycetospora corticicola]
MSANVFLDADGWPLVDRLLADLYRHHVTVADTATVYSGTRFLADTAAPAIRCSRLPGGGREQHQDRHRIEVLTWGRTRAESDAILAQVRGLNAEYSDEGWADVELDRIREDTGPGRVPDPNPSVVPVPLTLVVTVRQQGPGIGWAGMDEDPTTGAPITP